MNTEHLKIFYYTAKFKNFTNNFYIKSIYQTPEYAYAMNEQKYDSIFLGLENDGVIVAASLILIKKESGFYTTFFNV